MLPSNSIEIGNDLGLRHCHISEIWMKFHGQIRSIINRVAMRVYKQPYIGQHNKIVFKV